jgi:hypothetical protein
MADVLYIKYQASDNGTRPIDPNANFWTSPSVWLTDANGNGLNNQAVVGQDNVINVQVDSLSATALSGVKVQVWVDDFTLGGVGPDAVVIGGTISASGVTSTVPTAVSSSAGGVAQVHWTPNDAYLINSPLMNQGHVCVGANVYVEGASPEGAIKTSGLLDVLGNQHHAQKNIAVIKTVNLRGQKEQLVQFALRAVNTAPQRGEFGIVVTEPDPKVALGPLEKEQLLTASFVELAPVATPVGGPVGGPVGRPVGEPAERGRLRAGGQLVLAGLEQPVVLRPAQQKATALAVIGHVGRGNAITLAMEPGDRIPVTLQATLGGEVGDIHVFDITQTAGDGTVVGGARIIAVNTPAWLLG